MKKKSNRIFSFRQIRWSLLAERKRSNAKNKNKLESQSMIHLLFLRRKKKEFRKYKPWAEALCTVLERI